VRFLFDLAESCSGGFPVTVDAHCPCKELYLRVSLYPREVLHEMTMGPNRLNGLDMDRNVQTVYYLHCN